MFIKGASWFVAFYGSQADTAERAKRVEDSLFSLLDHLAQYYPDVRDVLKADVAHFVDTEGVSEFEAFVLAMTYRARIGAHIQ